MYEISNHNDLCLTCENGKSCTYPKSQGRPICYCEEHEEWKGLEGGVSLSLLKQPLALSRNPEATGDLTTDTSGVEGIKGLCVNCENRETCVFPKPLGGVWHCEEYL